MYTHIIYHKLPKKEICERKDLKSFASGRLWSADFSVADYAAEMTEKSAPASAPSDSKSVRTLLRNGQYIYAHTNSRICCRDSSCSIYWADLPRLTGITSQRRAVFSFSQTLSTELNSCTQRSLSRHDHEFWCLPVFLIRTDSSPFSENSSGENKINRLLNGEKQNLTKKSFIRLVYLKIVDPSAKIRPLILFACCVKSALVYFLSSERDWNSSVKRKKEKKKKSRRRQSAISSAKLMKVVSSLLLCTP